MKKILRIFDRIRDLKFRNKLMLSYLLISIIPVIVLGTYSYHQANTFLRQQAEENISNSVKKIEENINFRCTQYETVMNSIIFNIKFRQLFGGSAEENIIKDYVDPFFNNILFLNNDILDVSVFTKNKSILRGQYILPMELISDLDWYKKVTNTDKLVWASKNQKLICTQLFTNEDGISDNPAAVLYMNIDTRSLFEELDNINGIKDFTTVVVNDEGTVVYLKAGSTNINYKNNFLKQLKNDRGSFIAGKESITYYKVGIPKAQWVMYSFIPSRQIAADASPIAEVTVVIVGVCILGLFFMIWIFSNTFVRRINRLNKKMQIVENGNYQIEVSSRSKDEIGQLINRFGKMLANTNKLINEVYHSKIVQKDAEMRALQAQINPHFLYNTLSIINWKAFQLDALEICHMTNTMSKFYRSVLNKGKNIISVQNEIENAKAYIELQSIMHDNNFDFICKIDVGLNSFYMINLILQPILENALEHGIDMKKDGRGVLELAGALEDNNIVFYIRDNGPGMSKEKSDEVLETKSSGYGLKNVHERIKIFFGEEYGLKIQSEEGTGTTVKVVIPQFIGESEENSIP